MIGFIGTSVSISLNYNQYSAITDLHTFQFTVAHALGFSVSTSHLLCNGSQHGNWHFKSLWSLLDISCSITLEPRNLTELRLLLLLLPFRTLLITTLRGPCTENIYHVIATQPVHWRAGCCLAMVSAPTYRKHVTWPLPTVMWRQCGHKENIAPVLLAMCVLRAKIQRAMDLMSQSEWRTHWYLKHCKN
jgi:hypothetical protein